MPSTNVSKKTRETINVLTIAVIHYFSQWAPFWSICDCTNFTKLVPLQTPSNSGHWRFSVKKVVLKNLQNFTGKQLCWSFFLINLQDCKFIKRDSNTGVFKRLLLPFLGFTKLNHNVFFWLSWRHRFLYNNIINC